LNTRLILLRHGETQSNLNLIYQGQGDSPLTELGILEAQQLSEALRGEKLAGIYSSTLSRSFETARIVAEKHKLEVVKIPELIERFYGVFEGLTFEEVKKKYPKDYKEWLTHPYRAQIPKSEPLDDLQKRGVAAIERILAAHQHQTVCVVGHGAVNRAILFHYMNLALDNFWRVKQDNCCVNIIEFDLHPMVTLLNSTWFLGEKRVSKVGIY
jgi:broad specificity phosphatase PhoE